MSLRIQTNVAALNTHRQLELTDARLATSLERLSSGYRINRAKDDAAGLGMSMKFEAQTKSLTVASRNTTQANAMLQVAEGGADQIHNMLIRLKELATQAASYNSNANLTDIDAEAQKLLSEVNRIANSTKYLNTGLLTGFAVKGGGTLTGTNAFGLDVTGAQAGSYTLATNSGTTMTLTFNGVSQVVSVSNGAQVVNFTNFGISFRTTDAFIASVGLAASTVGNLGTAFSSGIAVSGTNAAFQVGDTNNTNNQLSFQISSIDYNVIGSATVAGSAAQLQNLKLDTLAHAQAALDIVDQALTDVNTVRGSIGALQNRLDYTYGNLQTTIENASAAESVIRDVDMASEMTTMTKQQILLQAGTAMLAQANIAPQQVLALMR